MTWIFLLSFISLQLITKVNAMVLRKFDVVVIFMGDEGNYFTLDKRGYKASITIFQKTVLTYHTIKIKINMDFLQL